MLLRNARPSTQRRIYLDHVPKYCSASSNSKKSILLQPDNPILNPAKYALHKARDGKTSWKHAANPYVNMLASPMRKCMWSNRVMPRDFLIPIKAASFAAEDGKNKTSIFPRALLHPSSLPASDSKGKKSARGYVVCLRQAMRDFVKRAAWMRLDPASESNPLLPFMVQSQLRRRVVQELEILRTVCDSKTGPRIKIAPFKQAEMPKYLDDVNMRTTDAPAALLYYARSHLVEAASPFSNLLPWYSQHQPVGLEWKDLQQHRVPIYNLASLFHIPSYSLNAPVSTDEASALAEQTTKKTASKGKAEPPSDYLELSRTHPSIYKRELELCANLSSQSINLLNSLTGAVTGENSRDTVFVIPSGEKSFTPLSIALWRWRMWIGEGWEIEDANELGFGMARATARTGRISVVA